MTEPFEPLPETVAELLEAQERLGKAAPEPWMGPAIRAGGVFVAFERGLDGHGAAGDLCWASAVTLDDGKLVATSTVTSEASASYEPGLLFLRVGHPLVESVQQLPELPDVLLVNGTGRDHPRHAGLAVHAGAVLGLPTIGVTHRPLIASGEWPPNERGASSALAIGGEVVGHWLRTRAGTRPLAVHAGWRTGPTTAVEVVSDCLERSRTPEPLRLAREAARRARAQAVRS